MSRIIYKNESNYQREYETRTLTVGQLIEYLQQLDASKPIHLEYDNLSQGEELHIYQKDEKTPKGEATFAADGDYYIPCPSKARWTEEYLEEIDKWVTYKKFEDED